jgi:hypothetical protein
MSNKEPDRYQIKHDPTRFKAVDSEDEIHEVAVTVAKEILTMFNDPDFKGYKRSDETTAKFFSALVKAMTKYPNLRVGQLIYAAMQNAQPPAPTAEAEMDFMTNFHARLFNIYDETLTEALEKFVAGKAVK